jgi:hypothetical protein
VNRPFFTSRTGAVAGVISTTPSEARIDSGMPGSSPAYSRIFLGMTNRPAASMVVFMATLLPP